ncbi:protein piccolo isoform X3 [Triplophysa rosa]|uniref:protein piccolo isoform X3 n=1 Tax=Triplophysa rosa TaxID=992332 RepID=UPI002546200E|nr:protein piccolo isoform X3 [Triplophysa rosa]
MGNEASAEGGEGALAGLPAGLASDGKGGFIQMPSGVEADLSSLSEEERKQLVAAMAKAQSRPPETQASGTRALSGLSKSRTVDAFGEGPPPKPKPGRSPSSLSLLESRFRQEPKHPEQPRTGMFSSGFLSGANPLSAVSSAVSSASIPKFSLFGDDEEEDGASKKDGKPPGPQGGAGKGPPQQGGKPPQQGKPGGPGPKPGGPGPQQQGPKPGGPGPQQQGLKPGGPAPQQQGPKPVGPGPQQQGPKPVGPGPQQQGSKPGGQGPQQQGPKPGGPGSQQQGPKPGGPGPQQQGPKPGGPGPQQQGPKPGGPGPHQQGPKPGGPGPQQQGPKPGGPGPQQQGPKPGGPGPQQQGPKPGGPGPQQQGPKPGGLGSQQQGKPGPATQTEGPGKTGPVQGKVGGTMCPLCKSTQLNVQAKDQPPNYNTCTQCKQQVCSLCGFSPPDSEGKEWLCLNCQMQRAVGGMEPPGPPMMKQPPKQGSAPPSPQKKEPLSGSPSKGEPGKKPPMLTKQQSIADTGKGSTPPATPKSGPGPQQASQGPQPGPPGAKRGQPPPLQKPAQSPKGSPQPSPAKTTPKQDGGGFFGGFGLGSLTEVTKPSAGTQATESVTGKLFGSFGGASKPQGGSTAQASESVTGKLFSGFTGLTESAKPPPSSQSSESVSGKMFGFGSSILSSATNLITGEEPKSPPESPPGSPPDFPVGSGAESPPGSPPDSGSESPPDTPPAYSKDPASPKPAPAEGKELADTFSKSAKAEEPLTQVSGSDGQSCCPLCKAQLNVGSVETPNYNTCTACQKIVCNLCGFNPTPHLSENEWLCLNCQTQRALSGQLGDMPPPPSPSKLPAKHEPTPPSSPAHATSSTPSSSAPTATHAKGLMRMPSITQASADKAEPVSAKVDAKDVKSTDAVKEVKSDSMQKMEEASVPLKDNELLREPSEKDKESSPSSPTALAKLESTVLPILEPQATTEEKPTPETSKVKRRLEVLPTSPEPSSEEDQHETNDQNNDVTKKERKKLLVPTDIQGDIFEDSSDGAPSPELQGNKTVGEKEVEIESPASVDEEFIRKQIIDMSADEDASPSDEENLVKQKIKDHEKKRDDKDKSESAKSRRLLKKSSISPEDEPERKSIISVTKIEELAKGEQPSLDSGTGIRHFKTIEFNSTATVRQTSDDGEPESLTDSPDDRSRGEGSSSLHASSFTPGTSPTSLSSLDEDSDSSSPSNVRSSGEGKQHRKAKHRQQGQMLPTIEDSSEEDELREEEELLREQEKQKGSGKKSKKDKEEIRAQRRRERPKTPPSNLSPIEDASPTEELRQEAEMEEFRRSSCSDLSPSMDSETESFEILPEKIVAVQKVYQLPTSVSLYSPTDEQHAEVHSKEKGKRSLKSADEAYEEIMLKAKSPTTVVKETPPGKESLYGGMLIEDYAYESLVDDGSYEKVPENLLVSEKPKKPLRSPDEVYEDMIQKKKEIMLKEQELTHDKPKEDIPKSEILFPSTDSSKDISSVVTGQSGKDGRPLLDAEAAYEDLMKKQRAVLTPGTSPTQAGPDLSGITLETTDAQVERTETAPLRRILPIPDLRVTQCSSGEEESGEESITDQAQECETAAASATKPLVNEDFQQTLPSVLASESGLEDVSLQKKTASPAVSSVSQNASETNQDVDETGIVDLSKSSALSQIDSFSTLVPSVISRPSPPVVVSVSSLPTVPQYIVSTAPSVVSTAPPVPPKPAVLRRGASLEKADIPVPPPLPPPTLPKPSVYPKKTPPQVPPRTAPVGMSTSVDSVPVRQPLASNYKPHVPPPVPPKPSSIPAGLTFSHKPGETVKPPIAPKPITGSQPTFTAHASVRPTILGADSALNLSPSAESKTGTTSPLRSPSSPRFAKVLRDTYVVITLPSQPGSPTDSITTQAPSPGQESPQKQPSSHPQTQPPPQPQTTRVPLAFTRITKSIESQEICGPEKVVSSMSHVCEVISATTQPQSIIPHVDVQVVTTELQRTTVSVVHERTPPPCLVPRPTGVPVPLESMKPEPVQVQNGHVYHPGEVVDLRTPKIDSETSMKGVDLSSSESRRQSLAIDAVVRQQSAVQSSVVNLSTDTSSVSVVTDSITILTCTATVAYGNDTSHSTSMPLQLTTVKSFEPVSQIIYKPVDSQPEKPINLSTTVGKTHTPVTIAPTITSNGINAKITPGLEIGLSGAVDLTTVKPAQTIVTMNGSTAEMVTAVVTEDDGKPVDLTAGRTAVCCDVVYKLPFAGSCATQQPSAPLPEDRFGYRDDHYQYDRTPYGMRGLGGINPSMSDTNLAEAGLFLYKSKHSYDYKEATEGAVDLTSGKMSGEAVDYSNKATGVCSGMTVPQYTQARITSAVGTHYGVSSVLRCSNGVVYSSVAAPVPSTYAITTQPGSIFSTSYNSLSSMHTSDTMPSLSTLQNQPLTRSHSFLSTIAVTTAEEPNNLPLNLEAGVSKAGLTTSLSDVVSIATTVAGLDTYTNASLEAIAASLEALSSPMVPGDGQYQVERELLELEKMKQQHFAEKLEWERQEIQRFREQEQLLVQKELEELQAMKQQILCQQEDERQVHLLMQKETYAQQQEQLEQIQRLQEQLRQQLEEQKFRQMYPGEILPEALVVGERKMDSGCQTDEEDDTEKAYTAGRKKKSAKKSVDSCVQTDDEDQDEWEVPARGRRSRARGGKNGMGERGGVSVQALTEISVQTDSLGTLRGHSVQVDTRVDYPDSDRTSSPKRRPTPLDIGQSPHLKADASTLQVAPGPPKSPKVLYSPISPCVSPSKSLEYLSYDKSLGETSPQRIPSATDLSKGPPSPRAPKVIQRSMSDPKAMSPTAEERAAANFQYSESYSAKDSPSGTPSGTQKKVKRTLPNPPSEEEATNAGQTAYSTGSARRRLCRNTNMARAKILQDIDRELDLVERESSKLRKKQAELDEEEKEIDAKLRYLEMGINRRKDALLKEREKRERAYLQSVAEDRDYMSDSEVSNIRETRGGEEVGGHGLERPRTAPQSELDDFVPPQTKHEYGKYSQFQYPQYQQSLYQPQSPYQSQSMYSSVPSLTASQQQSYHQMLLLQQKAMQQAALLSELDSTKIATNYDSSSYLGGKYGNHLDLRSLEDHAGSMAVSPMSNVSADSFYADLDQHHQTPRSYMLLEDTAELAKSTGSLSSTSYERELAKAERLLRRTAADVGTDYLGTSSRIHSYGKAQDEDDPMEEPFELKLLKQQLKQEFRRSTGGTESLEQLAGLSHSYTSSTGVSSGAYRAFPKTEKYSISRLTLEKQAAKQLPTSVLYQKHKNTSNIGKYSSIQDSRGLETDYSSYLGSSSASQRSSRLLQDEITFGLRKNIAEQQKYLGSTLGANLAGSLNLGQSLNLSPGMRSLGEDSAYPSGSRSRPSSRPSSVYGLDLSLKRDTSSSSLRLKAEGDPSSETSAFQTPSGRSKPTSLPIGQGGRGRIPIVAQNSEEESPLSPVGQPMGMARASAGPLPPISADSRDQFGSCLSLQDSQQQHLRDDPSRVRSYVLMDDLQGNMSDSEALSESLMGLNRDDPGNSHENVANAYHLRREETDWFDKPRDGRAENGQGVDRRQGKSSHYPFPHTRIKLQKDSKDRSVSGNGLGIRIVGGKEVPGSSGDIGAYVAKILPGGAAEQTGKMVEGMQVLEWNGISLTGKTYEEVQGLVGHQVGEAEICIRLDLNMLSDSESSHLDLQDQIKGDRPPRSPGVDPKQLAAELQKVSQQQVPSSSTSALDKPSASTGSSAVPSPGQPGSPSVSKKRHSKSSEVAKTQSHPVSGEIQLQINYDKQLGNLIVHVLQARNLAPRDNNGYSDPFVKVYLLPGRGAENKRRSKHAQKSLNPEWNQTVIYKNIHLEQLRKKTLEVSVWDYDKSSANDFLGEVLIDLSNTSHLDNVPRWLPLKEQSDGEHHRRSHSGHGRQHSPKPHGGHGSQHSPKTSSHSKDDSPRSSVIKSRSHGIFPDPSKDTQVPTIEKSHSSPSTSKPSLSEGQARPRGGPRAHGKSGTARAHLDNAASTEAAGQQPRQQPTQNDRLALRQHRHSVPGVLTIQRAPSESPANEIPGGLHLTLRKALSEERPQPDGASRSHRSGDAPVTAASLDSGLSGSAFSLLDEEGVTNAVDSAIFQVPRFGKIPNGMEAVKSAHGESEGKTQVMGEIKIALKKEMKTEGEHLVLEILQCRNITYKFKSPDHLPDLYVKLYVVNVATQKRIIKKKTRVCRHDREPSFNETFRFCMNPTGHSIQLFLVSNGGKFVKKTLIGEAYVWLDKVDLRKRVVSWHKLLASTAQIQS